MNIQDIDFDRGIKKLFETSVDCRHGWPSGQYGLVEMDRRNGNCLSSYIEIAACFNIRGCRTQIIGKSEEHANKVIEKFYEEIKEVVKVLEGLNVINSKKSTNNNIRLNLRRMRVLSR